ncbi:hypothetical protein HMPREF9530_00116 [Escherichia coli MS 21-1]|jgi:hypothetical protein|nr:hypothetical protein [Escherichia coli]EFK23219.1 hypothetical protein HMPREF9530_00116 [Escherichia coli MS 21-1]
MKNSKLQKSRTADTGKTLFNPVENQYSCGLNGYHQLSIGA